MMDRLFSLLGVDFRQWKALTASAVRLDLRAGSTLMGRSRGDSGSGLRSLIWLLVFYLFTSLFFAVLAAIHEDAFLTASIHLSFVAFMIGAAVLVEFNSIVISPDDFAILGYRPISSRTFFFARLANILYYTLLLALGLGIIPALVHAFAGGFRPLLGLASLLACFWAAAVTTLCVVLIYAAILRYVNPGRLRRALSYLQLILTLLIYGGYGVLPRMADWADIRSWTLTKTIWVLLYPISWPASYLDLARGRMGLSEILPALASLAALAGLLILASRKLSLGYSERLAALDSHTEAAAKPRRRPLLFRRDEGRAIALLIRSQFRYDQRFRLSVLGILPLTLFYLFLSLSDGPMSDPFIDPGKHMRESVLIYLAVLLFPMMLTSNLTRSDSFSASWIYHATPADKARMVRSMKNFVMAYFVAPYLLLISFVFAWYFASWLHVCLHMMAVAALAHVALQLAVWVEPILPFSEPIRKGRRAFRLLIAFALLPAALILLLPALFGLAYASPSRALLLIGVLSGLSWLVERLLGSRVRRRVGAMQFLG